MNLWTIRNRIETALVFALLIFLIFAVPIAIGLACVMIPQLGDLIGLFFATWWIVGLIVIGPILLLGWLWDTWHKAPGRHNSWPYVRAIPPTKINRHPIDKEGPQSIVPLEGAHHPAGPPRGPFPER
jgi:hypothetical protein